MYSSLRNWFDSNPLMAAGVGLQLVLATLALAGMLRDNRQILGLNAWMKPFKFDVSVLIMLVTFDIFLSGIRHANTLKLWAGASLAVSLTLENTLISFQALRGVRSHMNYATLFDAHVFAWMGMMVAIATVAVAVTLGLFCVDPPPWPMAIVWGIRLGLLMLVAGCVEGGVMVAHGGHTVGAIDGLSGLPVINWSRKHGDLRIAHFFALHAVQAFPLVGYLCSRTSWAGRVQVIAVFGVAVLYTVAVWLLFRQAMHGRPLLP